jgi:hypothetical protein
MSTEHERIMLFIEGKLNYDTINKCFIKPTNIFDKLEYGICSFSKKNNAKTIKLTNNQFTIKSDDYNIFIRSSYN